MVQLLKELSMTERASVALAGVDAGHRLICRRTRSAPTCPVGFGLC